MCPGENKEAIKIGMEYILGFLFLLDLRLKSETQSIALLCFRRSSATEKLPSLVLLVCVCKGCKVGMASGCLEIVLKFKYYRS